MPSHRGTTRLVSGIYDLLVPGLARAASLIVIASLSLWPGVASALDRAGSRWSDPVPLDPAGTYVGVSAVGASGATRIVVGERRDRTADAWISRAALPWGRATAPPAWATPPYDPSGALTPGAGGYGCWRSALAAAPDGSVVAVCAAGVYGAHGPALTAALLSPGSATFSAMPVEHRGYPVQPHVAIAGDGTLVGSTGYVDPSQHGACDGLAWQGPFGDSARWHELKAVAGTGDTVAAGADGSLLVLATRCGDNREPSGRSRLVVAARRARDARFAGVAIAHDRTVSTPTFAAVAANGRMLVAWPAADPGYWGYGPRWASIGSAVLPRGSSSWSCRPVVGQAACALGSARARQGGSGAVHAVHAGRIYALVALPDSSFLMLFSGLTGPPVHPGGLYVSRLAPEAAAWSPARQLDPRLYVSSSAPGVGPAAVALDERGDLLAAWPHQGDSGPPSMRIERLAAGTWSFTLEADLIGAGVPFEPVFTAPPDGAPAIAWIDATSDFTSQPSGRLLVADARAAG